MLVRAVLCFALGALLHPPVCTDSYAVVIACVGVLPNTSAASGRTVARDRFVALQHPG